MAKAINNGASTFEKSIERENTKIQKAFNKLGLFADEGSGFNKRFTQAFDASTKSYKEFAKTVSGSTQLKTLASGLGKGEEGVKRLKESLTAIAKAGGTAEDALKKVSRALSSREKEFGALSKATKELEKIPALTAKQSQELTKLNNSKTASLAKDKQLLKNQQESLALLKQRIAAQRKLASAQKSLGILDPSLATSIERDQAFAGRASASLRRSVTGADFASRQAEIERVTAKAQRDFNRRNIAELKQQKKEEVRALKEAQRAHAEYGKGIFQNSTLLRNFFRFAIGYQSLYTALNAVKQLARGVADLDKELRSIQAISEANESQMISLGQAIRQVAITTKFNTTEIAGAAKVLAQAGVEIEKIPAVLRAVSSFAAGTDSSLETASDV
ncbi:MAG: phage tail tape measure protein, partial [Bdellovibrionales bacterium]|nr:phage tail tape measure protein [Bdellovibrionales bacterium]